MALRDISNVTRTLIELIDRAFRVPENWPTAMTVPTVMAEPPVRSSTNGIGMFLYHITEHSHYKNLPATGRDTPPVRYTPLALTLYYQLSAYTDAGEGSGNQDQLMEQELMSVAMKALHDYPELTDTTIVDGALDPFSTPITTPIFPLDIIGRSNRFKITYQPIQPAESIGFWNTGDSDLTLSAYYEVNVVLIEPEVSRTRSGRVLDYNIFTFVTGNPKITSSSNEVAFISPVNGQVRELILMPAQVPPAPPILPPDTTAHRLTLKGLDFVGDVRLRLTNTNWSEPATTDATWLVEQTSTEYNVIVREEAFFESSGLPAAIIPGVYGAQLISTVTKNKSDGTTWPIELSSNVCPFAIVPRLDTIGVPAAMPNTAPVTG